MCRVYFEFADELTIMIKKNEYTNTEINIKYYVKERKKIRRVILSMFAH